MEAIERLKIESQKLAKLKQTYLVNLYNYVKVIWEDFWQAWGLGDYSREPITDITLIFELNLEYIFLIHFNRNGYVYDVTAL